MGFYFANQSRDIFRNHHYAERSWRIRGFVHGRKCSASNRIIAAKDHASIQLNIADVDEKTGRMTGTTKTYAICGTIRRMGESDDCINRLAKKRWHYSEELLIKRYVSSKGKYNKS